MRYWIAILMALVLTGSSLAKPADAPVVELSSVENLKLLESFQHGIVLFAAKGTEIQLSLTLSGELTELASEGQKLKFKRDTYLYFPKDDEEEPLFSLDGESWKNWEDMFSGSLSLGVQKGKTVNLVLTLNPKKL